MADLSSFFAHVPLPFRMEPRWYVVTLWRLTFGPGCLWAERDRPTHITQRVFETSAGAAEARVVRRAKDKYNLRSWRARVREVEP